MKSLDEIFELFSRERRRFALYYLEQADGKVSIEELAEQIYEWETTSPSDEFADEKYEEILISLEHSHLPSIEAATHIEYDRDNNQLQITGLSPEVDVLLSVTNAIEQPSKSEDITLGDHLR